MLARILYVEDDETLSYITKDNLEMNDFEVELCMDGLHAWEKFQQEQFDLCILDIMLPKMDGFNLAKKIRERDHHIPIIFLSAKSMKEDKIQGLMLGGDDYLTKPYSIEELILKIKVFLKRSGKTLRLNNKPIQLGQFEFKHAGLQLISANETKSLTQKEADLLQMLVHHQGNILKRADILETIWGENDYFLGRSLDVFISRLRKYLRSDERIKIENIHGVGFRLVVRE